MMIKAWLHKNLFSTWYNSLLTIVCLVLLGWICQGLVIWATTQAQWSVLQVNLRLFWVGRFPPHLYWRVWTVLAITATLTAITVGAVVDQKTIKKSIIVGAGAIGSFLLLILPVDGNSRWWCFLITILLLMGWGIGQRFSKFIRPGLSLGWPLSFLVILWLLAGGLGLPTVSTNLWNGLLLTLLMAVVSIVLSFPVGVLLALGRTSTLPVVKWSAILYIEIMRGLPLIGILFLAQVMLPLFLPADIRLDRVLRAIAGLVLFSAAYMAENVRGGLQAIPRGQIEAAKALGLSAPLVIVLIVLPQALRAVIPAIVGQFIGLFKDTSLLSLVGLMELTGIARSVLAQPGFIGRYAEVYLFIGFIYFLFCYSMSLLARRLEKHLTN